MGAYPQPLPPVEEEIVGAGLLGEHWAREFTSDELSEGAACAGYSNHCYAIGGLHGGIGDHGRSL